LVLVFLESEIYSLEKEVLEKAFGASGNYWAGDLILVSLGQRLCRLDRPWLPGLPFAFGVVKMTVQDQVAYEFGVVRINLPSRKLIRDGECVQVQARGFDALLLLVQKRNEVVSKAELLSTIWPDTYVEESNLPVMISAIRRAIGDDGRNQKYIQTVSKFGYRFVGEVTEIRTVEPAVPTVQGPSFEDPMPTRRYARFSVVAGCAAAALAAMVLVYRLNGNSGEGHVAAASQPRAVFGGTEEGVRASSRSDAETWYLKGHYAWNLQTKGGFLQSIEYYQKAIASDPGYAAAYAGLASSYVKLPSYSAPPAFERARAAALKAVSLDDGLADAHISLGMVVLIVDRNFARAEREFRRAILLDPHSSLAEGQLALCLAAVGQTEEAVAHARRAKALDPLSVRAATDLGIVLYYSRRLSDAASEFEEVLKLDPYYYRAELHLGETYLSLGRFDDARRVLAEASILPDHDPAVDGLMAEAKARGGDIDGAKAFLAALEQRARTTYVDPMNIAYATVGLGRMDDTLVYLRKARNERTIGAVFLKVDPRWDALHGNSEFGTISGITPTATE
jgi:DNA-binding winged helix-turn-helix (wHTH) protein/Flp pilus assembly protein TadD